MFAPRGEFGRVPPGAVPRRAEEDEEDDEDETLTERLMGLTEMFPEGLRNAVGKAWSGGWWLGSNGIWLFRNGLWIFSTTALIAFAPLAFEIERLNAEEATMQRQQQLLLGPAVQQKGGMGSVMGAMPGPASS